MSDTVESIHNKIIDKISGLRRCLETTREIYRMVTDLGYGKKIPINLMLDDLAELENAYNFATVDLLTRYYRSEYNGVGMVDADDSDMMIISQMIKEISTFVDKPVANQYAMCDRVETPDDIVKKYYRVITAENFVARANEFINRVKSIVGELSDFATSKQAYTMGPLFEKVIRLLSQVSNLEIQIQTKKSNYEQCSKCGNKMEVVPSLSELKCTQCGRVKTLYGTVFEDHQFYNQEGQKTKHGSYDPNRHFRFWMDRIQAKERMSFPQTHLDKIESIINRYYPPPIEVNCMIMRNILKEARLTKYNDHTPLLVKMFTGRSPPQLTHNEMRTFAIKFSKIMEIYEQYVKKDGDGNRPYYPYFIYKIAEDEFKDNPEKLKILEYIHLQSDPTIINHDLIYKQICQFAPEDAGLVYRTTNSAERRV